MTKTFNSHKPKNLEKWSLKKEKKVYIFYLTLLVLFKQTYWLDLGPTNNSSILQYILINILITIEDVIFLLNLTSPKLAFIRSKIPHTCCNHDNYV